MLFTGSFQGVIIVRNIDTSVTTELTVSAANDSICNCLTAWSTPASGPLLVSSNNDKKVKILDLKTEQVRQEFEFKWAVNHSSGQPNGNLIAVVGDGKEGYIYDTRTKDAVATLEGHHDFSFSTAWDPAGVHLATANQDQTCRVWDIRKTKVSEHVLAGRMASLRSVQYSHDGKYLGVAESADFIHLYNVEDVTKSQQIDFFGEISGFQFSPDDSTLFIGVTDCYYGCVMEWHRNGNKE